MFYSVLRSFNNDISVFRIEEVAMFCKFLGKLVPEILCWYYTCFTENEKCNDLIATFKEQILSGQIGEERKKMICSNASGLSAWDQWAIDSSYFLLLSAQFWELYI